MQLMSITIKPKKVCNKFVKTSLPAKTTKHILIM